MGDGFGTYIKIDSMIIKEKSIFNIGSSYLCFSYDIYLNEQNNKKSKKFLFLTIFNKEKKFEPLVLGKDKTKYTIGRTNISDIQIDDILLSKINCTLTYNDDLWKIKDGDEKGNNITNGTWFYALDDNEIFNNMNFKSNKYNFYCKFSK